SESTASKDVFACRTKASFIRHRNHLLKHFSPEQILVEEYIDGPQYIIETLTINGKVHIIAIIEQQIEIFNDHFIITGYQVIHDYPKQFYRSLKKAIKHIIKTIGLYLGPCHF